MAFAFTTTGVTKLLSERLAIGLLPFDVVICARFSIFGSLKAVNKAGLQPLQEALHTAC